MSELGYASAAGDYWNASWRGILPLPPSKKVPPPKDTTGYGGRWPSWPDIMAWSEDHPDGNLALRLPNTVVGVDVDDYANKRGGDTLAHAESLWGALPPTVRSTSRLDGKSGIRLYRIAPGVELETLIQFPELGLGGIEVIQNFHRYCVAWPSVHEGTGRRYQWLDAEGNITPDIPRPAALPPLPAGWIEGLRRRHAATTINLATPTDVNKALRTLPSGTPSPKVAAELASCKATLLANSGTRHDTTLKSVLRLLRLGEQGESGAQDALGQLEDEFVKVVTKDGSRDAKGARLEFRRMVTGQRGHDLIAETPTLASVHQIAGIQPAEWSIEVGTAAELEMTESQADALLFGADFFVGDRIGPENFQDPRNPPGDFEYVPSQFDSLLFSDEPEEVGTTASKTSWGPVDLDAVLSGELRPEEPAFLLRTDGKFLLYRGRVNSLVGAPESGKSWCALIACQQAMANGENVLYLDFEDVAANIVMRLLALGASRDALRKHFAYAAPDTALGIDEQEDITRALDTMAPGVVVVDGVNAAMTLMGLDLNKNVDATQFHQLVLKPLTRIGSAVLTVDHVTKSSEGRGGYAIGAQAKKAMTDGAMIGVHAVEPFGRGRLGKLGLVVLKDKPGGVRAVAEPRGNDGNRVDYLANVIIDARDENNLKTEIYFDEKNTAGKDGISKGEKSLIVKMMEVSKFLQAADPEKNGRSMAVITSNVPGRDSDVRGAVAQLIEIHHVEVIPGPRGAKLHLLKSAYLGPEHADLSALAGE